MTTLTYTVALATNNCPTCGVLHAFPDKLEEKALADHARQIYCPNGHAWHFTGTTKAEQERDRRIRAEDRAAAERARADQAEASLRATKGVVTRMRKRAITGTCAFCHRHFANVERHVATQHPEETTDA